MLTIEIKINGRLIGQAEITNRSGLADQSDYFCSASSEASEVAQLPGCHHTFYVRDHARKQSAWALVAKVADHAAKVEAMAPGRARAAGIPVREVGG